MKQFTRSLTLRITFNHHLCKIGIWHKNKQLLSYGPTQRFIAIHQNRAFILSRHDRKKTIVRNTIVTQIN